MDYQTALKQISSSLLTAAALTPGEPPSWSAAYVQRLEATADVTLTAIRAALRDAGAQVNVLNPVNRLPDELLSRIFRFAYCPSTISSVCRHWRTTSLDDARLWTDIDVVQGRFESTSSVVQRLDLRLSRTKSALVDVQFRCGTSHYGMYKEPLLEHMHHLRRLALDVNERYLTHHWRVTLTMPAPRLEKLSLASRTKDSFTNIDYFPDELFTGHAPVLQDLRIRGLRLPSLTWPPLRGLTSLSYHGHSISAPQILAILETCQQLHTLALDVEDFQIDSPWNPDNALSSRSFAFVKLTLRNAEYFELEELLVNTALNAAHALTFRLCDDHQGISWFLSDFTAESLSIHSEMARLRQSGLVARATDGKGRTRTLRLVDPASGALRNYEGFSSSLVALSISEEYWPRFRSTAGLSLDLPKLRELTVLLINPVFCVLVYNITGVLCLSPRPKRRWELPALQSLSLAYVSHLARHGEEHPPYLTVSAHDVATFISSNIHSERRFALALKNVLLYEPPDHVEVLQLERVVDGWTLIGDYIAEPLDDGESEA